MIERQGDAWTQTAKLRAQDATGGDIFGSSMSLLGDRAVIGAWGDDDAPEDLDGSGLVDFGDLLIVLDGWGIPDLPFCRSSLARSVGELNN